MEANLHRRLQRSGWDLGADRYENLWSVPLAVAHEKMMAWAALRPGERVLDVACGSGVISVAAARAVGASGVVIGVDVSGRMVDRAWGTAVARGFRNATFERMDAECLAFPAAAFNAALCAFGLMYVADPSRAVSEMCRVVKPGGRIVMAVWGEQSRCGWAELFDIVDAELESEAWPRFFDLGGVDALSSLCEGAGLTEVRAVRMAAALRYDGAKEACSAAFVGGPAALAWSGFDDETRERVRGRYLESIKPWRARDGYRIPAEFVVASGRTPGGPE